MKNFIILAIILIIIWPTGGGTLVPFTLFEPESKAYGALHLYLGDSNNGPLELDDDDEVVSECKCNKKTGMISYDGGTSLVKCPCTGEDCCNCINCKNNSSGEQVAQEVNTENDKKPVEESTHKKSAFYIIKFTASWCKPCIIWNKEERPKVERAGYKVVEVDIDSYPKGKAPVSKIPAMWICRVEDKKAFPRDLAFTNPNGEFLIEKIRQLESITNDKNQVPTYIKKSNMAWKIDGNPNPSRETILSHLMNDPSHKQVMDKRWPLDFFSQQVLLDIHADSHEGKLGELTWQ